MEDAPVKMKISSSGPMGHCHRDQGRPVAMASTEPSYALSLSGSPRVRPLCSVDLQTQPAPWDVIFFLVQSPDIFSSTELGTTFCFSD